MQKSKKLLNDFKNNKMIGKFLSNSYAVNISILLILTFSVLLYSHLTNLIKVNEMATRSFEVYFDGNHVGNIRDKENFEQVLGDYRDSLQEENHAEVAISNTVEYVPSHGDDKDISTHDEIVANIESKIEYNILAYGIKVDGEILGELKTEEEAEEILEAIKEPYVMMMEDSEIVILEFAQDIEIVQNEVSKYEIDDMEKLLHYLQKGTTEEQTHIVEQGDNFWTISSQYNLTVDELISANSTINSELIHPGDKLSLIIPKPYIGVRTVELATYEEKIPYETEYEKVSWLYNDEYSVKKSGKYGIREVDAKIIRENGIEVEREVIEEDIISNPVTKVVYNGTIAPPPKKGTGTFINPLPSGYVSSRYGSRWGSYHYGVDIANSTGTPIKASDGGKVIYSGWFGDYGYMVQIDHGGGYSTVYAHCSKIYVDVGEMVYQGQKIAAVGSTGYSTGPHVHFEVRKYGVKKDPGLYVPVLY
jgi:murein DD-endopeptidase MepM/ murein hydrolase activator NlpD